MIAAILLMNFKIDKKHEELFYIVYFSLYKSYNLISGGGGLYM